MGGCRCIFRDCDVASNKHPDMHFFHFPVKTPERCERWIELSGALHLLRQLPNVVKNRVVCVRHFRDECFMNYMKKRLTKNALPTLMRYGDVALDYDTPDGKPKIVRIPKPVLSYLIKPSTFKCPLDFNEMDYQIGEKLIEEIDSEDLQNEYIIPTNEVDIQPISTMQPEMIVRNEKAKKRILNGVQATYAKKRKTEVASIQTSSNSTQPKQEDVNDEVIIFHDKVDTSANEYEIYGLEMDEIVVKPQKTLDKVKTTNDQGTQVDIEKQVENGALKDLTLRLKEVQQKLNDSQKCRNELRMENITIKNENLVLKNKQKIIINEKIKIEDDFLKMQEEYKKLKQHYNDLSENCKKLERQQQVSTVSTSSTSQQSTTAQVAFTKPQLFNGIKKYLSASMIALLRMEMFGNSEREWKPDERRTSMDILKLGENIYNFISDEWRFRLPAISHVRRWLSEANALVDDDEIDL